MLNPRLVLTCSIYKDCTLGRVICGPIFQYMRPGVFIDPLAEIAIAEEVEEKEEE
jgi:hypothetical protein